MSAISGTISGLQSAAAQRDASKKNLKAVSDTNRINMLMNLFTRGGALSGKDIPEDMQGQQSAILPYYFKDMETQLAGQARSASDAISGQMTPQQQLKMYQSILDKYSPSVDNNRNLASDIASGRMGDQMLEESGPVFKSRVDSANTRKNASLQALQDSLNEIDAIQARKGFSGDSFGNNLLKFNARRATATQSATDIAGANTQNAMDRAAILGQARNIRLNSLNLPNQMASSDISIQNLPGQGIVQRTQTGQAPFGFFNVGPNQFTPHTTPVVSAIQSPLGAAAGAVGQTGNTLLSFALNKSLANKTAGGGGGGWGGNGDWAGETSNPAIME